MSRAPPARDMSFEKPMVTYSGNLRIHDADSHLMEPPDWLSNYVDPAFREKVGYLDLHGLEEEAAQALRQTQDNSVLDPDQVNDLLVRKNWSALGAFDSPSRSRALDMLGFRSQLVFSTYSHLGMIPHDGSSDIDSDLLYAIVDGHNRGIVEFCQADKRLLPAGFVATQLPDRAIDSAEYALQLGCAGIELPSLPCGKYSLSHPAYYPLYQLLQERQVPLLFHVGGGGRLVHQTFAKNGRNPEPLYHQRETSMPSLTYVGIPAPVEMALAALILDGVFERFPELRCGVIEQGAIWVPGFLRRLDAALEHFGRFAQRTKLTLSPSEYFRRQVRVTPFPFEDLRWLIEEACHNIYLFGTDYPHDEGGEMPLELFEAALTGFPFEVREAIYCRNFEDLIGKGLPPSLRVQCAQDEDASRQSEDREILRKTGEPISVHRKKVMLRLLVRDFADRLGIAASEEEIQTAADRYRIECGLVDLNHTLEWMEQEKITDEALGKAMCDNVLAEKVYGYLDKRVKQELTEHLRVSTGRLWRQRQMPYSSRRY
jgi:uncharacterized protein